MILRLLATAATALGLILAPMPALTASGKVLVPVQQSSLTFSTTAEEKTEDVSQALSQGSYFVSLSEQASEVSHNALVKEAEEHGYRLFTDYGTAGEAIAVKRGIGPVVWSGYVPVLPAVDRSPTHRGHGPRGIFYVTVDLKWSLGRLTYATAHYLAKGPTPDESRHAENVRLAQAIGDLAALLGLGSNLFLFGGDTNTNDRLYDVFHGQSLATCWDDLAEYPSTIGLHSTVDVLARYENDSRVSTHSARVVPISHSNHKTAIAEYAVKPLS